MENRASPQPWQTLETTYPFVTPWFEVRQDRVRTHLGEEICYAYHEHPGCALVVAMTPDAHILLLEHYRYPVRAWCWEIPAGRLQEEHKGLETARRELLEEVGGVSENWQFVGGFYTSTGSSSERADVYLATDVRLRTSSLESTELLRVAAVPWKKALQMAQAGQISDGPSALALLMTQPRLQRLDSGPDV